MSKVGIVGLGHLGKIHVQQWLNIVPKENLICFDTDLQRMQEISSAYHISSALTFEDLLSQVAVVDVVTPTNYHFDIAKKALDASKHVFIEKPVCETVSQAEDLILAQQKAGTLVQIGHVERYNPAFLAVESSISHPKFFEIHRLAPYTSRGSEVSVIMDLMIHDLDIVTHLVHSDVKNIYANGVSILSRTPDIANVRIEFENGCVANLTASRISMKKMRKMRVFSDKGYTSIDFLERTSEIIEIADKNGQDDAGIPFTTNEGQVKYMSSKNYKEMEGNAIFLELSDFYDKIICRKNDTKVNLFNSLKTLKLAVNIQTRLY